MFFAHQTVGLWEPAIKLSVALLLCFWLITSNADAQDAAAEQNKIIVEETQKKLEQARERYRLDLEAYVQNVESYLERREEITRRSGDINLVNKAKEERRLFAEKGTLPASLPDRIKSAPQQSRTRLETMYSNAVKSYVRAGLDREAADLEKELQAFLKSPGGMPVMVKSEPISLFNGKDLTGWQKHPSDQSNWTVENGQLIGRGKTGYLFTDRGNFSDFVFRSEVLVPSGENGGIFLRSPNGNGIPGYEVDLNSPHRGTRESGTIRVYPESGSGFPAVIVDQPSHKADEWFTLETTAVANEITVKINGNVISRYTDTARHFTKGHLCLQHYVEGKEIRFRKIEIQEIRSNETSAFSASAAGDSVRLPEEEAVDLLPLINVQQHALRGSWRRSGNTISCAPSDTALVMAPVTVKANYSVIYEFTRRDHDDSTSLIFPVGEHSTSLILSGWGGTVSGLIMVGGQPLPNVSASSGAVARPGKLENGQRYRLQVNVAHNQEKVNVTATLNGQALVNWRGFPGHLSGWAWHTLPCPQAIGVSVNASVVDVHKLELTVHRGGEGYRLGQDFTNPLTGVAEAPPAEILSKCKQWNGRYYYITEQPVSFAYAQRLAASYQGRLLTISSAEENAFIAGQGQGIEIWMSGWRPHGSRVWRDERNRPLKYIGPWYPHNPASEYGPETQLGITTASNDRGKWYDYQPWKTQHVCIEWGEEYPESK